ncbi:MAG: PKD domain-containing protein [Acidimicrobiia bacterium]
METGIGSFPSWMGVAAVSGNGRYLVVNNGSWTLGADLDTGNTERLDVLPDGTKSTCIGTQGNPLPARVSDDGRWVAFESWCDPLPGTGPASGVFLRDRVAGVTTRVSEGGGSVLEMYGGPAGLSDDGRYVAYTQGLDDYPPGRRSWMWDRITGQRTAMPLGTEGYSGFPNFVAFRDMSQVAIGESCRVPGDTARWQSQVAVWDVLRGLPRRVSTTQAGSWPLTGAAPAGIVPDGSGVLFWTSSGEILPSAPSGGTFLRRFVSPPPGPNRAPVVTLAESSASPRNHKAPNTTVRFGCSDVYDPDGTIVSWQWDYGDGTVSSARELDHTYAVEGTYHVTLTVTDDGGASATGSVDVAILPPNVAPRAAIDIKVGCQSPYFLTSVGLDATRSTDPDGRVEYGRWYLDGNPIGEGLSTCYAFRDAGTHTVTLVAVDDDGAESEPVSRTFQVPNTPPLPLISATPASGSSPLAVAFDGTGSIDPDGTVAAWHWDFGDGTTGEGATTSHTYATPGTFEARLTVTDDLGSTATTTQQVQATNSPPVAQIVLDGAYSGAAPFTVYADGSGSADPDGVIAAYAWDFGDGQSAFGPLVDHTYSAEGTFRLRLTVTDGFGAVATAERSIGIGKLQAIAPWADRPMEVDALSDDGRIVVFRTDATNLGVAPGETTSIPFYLRDRTTGETVGLPGEFAALSGDGNRVAMGKNWTLGFPLSIWDRSTNAYIDTGLPWCQTQCRASLDVHGDVLATSYSGGDVTVHDLSAGTDEVVGHNWIAWAVPGPPVTLSADGRYVAFSSGDAGDEAAYLLDRLTHTSTKISPEIDPAMGGQYGQYPKIIGMTDDASKVYLVTSESDPSVGYRSRSWLYDSESGSRTELVGEHSSFSSTGEATAVRTHGTAAPDGTPPPDYHQVVLEDLATGLTRRVSVDSGGNWLAQGVWAGWHEPIVTPDARFVAFSARDAYVRDMASPPPGPANVAPIVTLETGQWSPESQKAPATVGFGTSDVYDPDGHIVSWRWDFGDGTTSTRSEHGHTYISPGTYHVTLSVTDDAGATSAGSVDVVILPPNVAPTASFTVQSERDGLPLRIGVDPRTSTDPDGVVMDCRWEWGDGGDSGTGPCADTRHDYAHAGTYAVSLTVTDNDGATATWSRNVVVPNAKPEARITATPQSHTAPLVATLDGRDSSDPDGWIVSWQWDLGDGTTATGPTLTHIYAPIGRYNVSLTVTDDEGATATATLEVEATNVDPVAVVSVDNVRGTSPLTVDADGAASVDVDGNIVAWRWDFGDGAGATTPQATHTYTGWGTYSLRLTVTDNLGGTGTTAQGITIGNPELVSVSSGGAQIEPSSLGVVALNDDGRYITFGTNATNLDAEGRGGVFTRDRQTGQTMRRQAGFVAMSGDGNRSVVDDQASDHITVIDGTTGERIEVEAPWYAWMPKSAATLDHDGHILATATPGGDVTVHDLDASSSEVIGHEPISWYSAPAPLLSYDGRYVAFRSFNVDGTDGGIWLRDRSAGTTTRVTPDTDLTTEFYSGVTAMSGDGRYIGYGMPRDPGNGSDVQYWLYDRDTGGRTQLPFALTSLDGTGSRGIGSSSDSSALCDDTNGFEDVMLYEVATGRVARVSGAMAGAQGNNWSYDARLSSDGSTAVFVSAASNLVPRDTNGSADVFARDLAGISFDVSGGPDSLSVSFTGGVTYQNSGSLTSGNLSTGGTVCGGSGSSGGSSSAPVRLNGTGTLAGTHGGSANVAFAVNRFWILPVYVGSITVSDPGAGLYQVTLVLFSRVATSGPGRVSGANNWVVTRTLPWRSYTLVWSITDRQ